MEGDEMKGIGIFILIFLATVYIKSLAWAENASDQKLNPAEQYVKNQIENACRTTGFLIQTSKSFF